MELIENLEELLKNIKEEYKNELNGVDDNLEQYELIDYNGYSYGDKIKTNNKKIGNLIKLLSEFNNKLNIYPKNEENPLVFEIRNKLHSHFMKCGEFSVKINNEGDLVIVTSFWWTTKTFFKKGKEENKYYLVQVCAHSNTKFGHYTKKVNNDFEYTELDVNGIVDVVLKYHH